MLFVSYSRRVRQTNLSAIASRADRPSRPSPSRDQPVADAHGAHHSVSLSRFASLPVIYDRTAMPALTGNGRGNDR